jgi:hypothetical protein
MSLVVAQKTSHPLRRRRHEGFRRLFRTPGAGLAGHDRNSAGGSQSFPGGKGLVTLDKEAKVGLNGGQMVFNEIAAELAPDYPPHP